jgi:UDP-glucose 4-epimerase
MVGSYVARALIAKGERPVLLDLSPDHEQISDIQRDVTVLKGNVLDLVGMIRAIKNHNVDRIVHTAGMLALGIAADPVMAIRVNVEGGTNVLEAARLTGARRVVFISTRQVYDFSLPMTKPVDEEFPKSPGGIYASTKLACEYLGKNYRDLYGLEFAALRFARVYGPGYWSPSSTPNVGTRAVKEIIENSLRGRPVVMKRPFGDRDEWLYARDAAQGIVCALEAKSLPHAEFNIGSGISYHFDDMVEAIRQQIPNSDIRILEHEREKLAHGVYQTLMPIPTDISRAEKELGYVPRFLLKASIADYVETLRVKWRASETSSA